MNLLVGIAGGTGAGKSTLARTLAARASGVIVELDAYYHDRSALPLADRARLNYDEPAAIDELLLAKHLDALQRGRHIVQPIYSFESHTRVGERPLAPAPVVIVEGLFTWWWPPLRSRLGVKIFVDAPADVRLARRVRRDIVERGRTAEHVLEQYLATVRPMHERYVEPCRLTADIVIPNDADLDAAIGRVVAAIGQPTEPRIEHRGRVSARR